MSHSKPHDQGVVDKSSPIDVAPLIQISSSLWENPIILPDSDDNKPNSTTIPSISQEQKDIGELVVKALQTTGFLLIESDLMPQKLQQQAIDDATQWLTRKADDDDDDGGVTAHPTDPKRYVMLESKHFQRASSKDGQSIFGSNMTPALTEYWEACEALKLCVLRAIGVGLQLQHPDDLALWHSQGQHSAIRLLYYPPATPTTGNRCKAHSDYGTVTLLSTDGVSGLEILYEEQWWPVPHVSGAMIVNIGSLLSEWTTRYDNQLPLLATLHRVAGPASEHSSSSPNVLQQAMSQGRTSIAFFADPDNNTPLSVKGTTIKDYIQWRSGGSDSKRSGVAFTASERELVQPDD